MTKSNNQEKQAESLTPSLLEDESRGGDTNEGGMRFQASLAATYATRWLVIEGFTSMLREGIGDIEARFFSPGHSYKKEFIEAKNHYVAPAEFWQEIARFQRVDAGAPGEYQWFTLATVGLSADILPLLNGLRRLRDPYGFYETGSSIVDNTFTEYVGIVKKLGYTAEEAEFLYKRALVDPDLNAHRIDPAMMFKTSLRTNHTAYEDLGDRVLEPVYNAVQAFIQSRLAQPITRIELERVIREALPENLRGNIPPVQIYTGANAADDAQQRNALYLPWADFSGGAVRQYPPAAEWNDRLVTQLRDTKAWILANRGTRRIRLSGSRRISAALAIGYMFPAVEGFALEMVIGDTLWASDSHPGADTPGYLVTTPRSDVKSRSERLVVSLGILRDGSAEVDAYLRERGLSELPVLHLFGPEPVVSAGQANLLVRNVKNIVSSALASTGATEIDLFLAVPSQVALFMGHRLNATARIQSYEWVSANNYTPTCLLM